MSELTENKSTDVSFTLRYAESAKVTMRGETEVIEPDENGVFTVHLESGDGAFVEVEENISDEQSQTEALLREYYDILMYKESIKKNEYTSESYNGLEKALEKFAKLIDKAEKEEINKALSEVKEAKDNLETLISYYVRKSEELITKTETLTKEYYTEETLNEYLLKIEELKEVKKKVESGEEITAAKLGDAYNYAVNKLKPVSYTHLDVYKRQAFSDMLQS